VEARIIDDSIGVQKTLLHCQARLTTPVNCSERRCLMWKRATLFQMVLVLAAICLNLAGVLAEDNAKININAASAEELVQLKGIGPKKAAVIIKFREANGPFRVPADLTKVPGIGPKTFEANKERIVVIPK
jgi:competence protein ComEA